MIKKTKNGDGVASREHRAANIHAGTNEAVETKKKAPAHVSFRVKRHHHGLSTSPPTGYLHAKKSLGQHFLKNPHVVEKMLAAAQLDKGAFVLEIGPGTGVLTADLLEADTQVIALEADARMITILEERFKKELHSGQLVLRHSDVREEDLTQYMPQHRPYSVVANIPYYLSSMLLRTLLESASQPKRIVFLVQKEVAERIARSKKESLLSLSVKAYGTPRYIGTVSRGNFMPPPRVDSAILLIEAISRARFKKLSEAWFFSVLHVGFASRRKQLLGNLLAHLDSEHTKEALLEKFVVLGVSPSARGEDLSIETWCALAQSLRGE